MKKKLLLSFCLSYLTFSKEQPVLQMPVKGRIVSFNENVVTEIQEGIQQIYIKNNRDSDIFILGKADKKTFVHRVGSGSVFLSKKEAYKITELYYISNGIKYELKNHSDLNCIN